MSLEKIARYIPSLSMEELAAQRRTEQITVNHASFLRPKGGT